MSMNKKFDNAYLNQYTDNVIKRGYEIYDEWINQKHDSRKIVASIYGAVQIFKQSKTMAAFIEALAYLFALDTRIKEKYNNILRCLFSYFSWRRETRALGSLKSELNIPFGKKDIRDLIAVVIEKFAEKLEYEWDEDEDDETHGGKKNGKAEEEVVSEEKAAEAAEEKAETEELADKEETKKDSEEKDEMPVEETPQEEVKEEIGEKIETAEIVQEEAEITATDKKEELAQEKNDNLKEENNVSDDKSEPSIDEKDKEDKKEEAKSYNDAVDSPPLYEEHVRERSAAEKTSFIDEMLIDNMVKGDKSIIGYQRIDEAERNKQADITQNTVASQNDKDKSTDKNAYLYDKMNATEKGEARQTLNTESTKQAEKAPETKTEQPKETVQNNDNVNSTKQEFKPLSEMFQSNNPNADPVNNIAGALNDNMSLESKMSLIRMREDQLREHMNITLEELGMNDTSDVLRVSEPEPIKQQGVEVNRK